MSKQFVRLTLMLAVLVLAACSGTAPVTDVVVKTDANGFSPATVEVAAGQPFRLTLDNTGNTEHQLAIKEFPMVTGGGSGVGMNMAGMSGPMDNMSPDMNNYQVHMVAQAGQRTAMEMTPSRPGQYEFFCMEPGHTERGILIVK